MNAFASIQGSTSFVRRCTKERRNFQSVQRSPLVQHQLRCNLAQKACYGKTFAPNCDKLPSATRRNSRNMTPIVAEATVESPPTSKAAAILQAQTALRSFLSTAGRKVSFTGNKKKKKQNKQSVVKMSSLAAIEIPLRDYTAKETADLVTALAGDFDLSTLVYFGDSSGTAAFQSMGAQSVASRDLNSVDSMELVPIDIELVIIAGAQEDQIQNIRSVTNSAKCAVVLLNPEWNPHEVPAGMRSFVSSFEVIYSHMPLAIQGFMKNSEGTIFRCVTDASSASTTPWTIQWNGQIVASQQSRPTPQQLELALYNKAAEESALVQAAKAFGNLRGKFFGGNK